ncbi:MAG: Glycosyl transferase group 1, partial [Candidatus Moranbacteria bacterium GW2011_GWE2_47_10]
KQKTKLTKVISLCLLFVLLLIPESWARKSASIAICAETGEVYHEQNADEITHPASLTKMMTLYLTFKAIKEKKLTDSVRIINPLNYFDLPKILNASDLAIDPKDSSTMQASGKILQYMAAGLPVACFDRENNRRYLGEAGEDAKEISGHGLADTILDLSRNHLEIGRKGEISRKRATDFSWVKSAEKIDQIYKKLSHP